MELLYQTGSPGLRIYTLMYSLYLVVLFYLKETRRKEKRGKVENQKLEIVAGTCDEYVSCLKFSSLNSQVRKRIPLNNAHKIWRLKSYSKIKRGAVSVIYILLFLLVVHHFAHFFEARIRICFCKCIWNTSYLP